MNIASEAVEVAAIAGYEARTGERWSGLDDDGREREEFATQCALEAAAPFIAAQAWQVVSVLHEPTCEQSGANCTNKECQMRICGPCGEAYPCPTIRAITEPPISCI